MDYDVNPMTSVVLSDIDGVLIDSANAVLASYRTAFKVKGLGLPDHIFWDHIWGNSWKEASLQMENCWCGEQDWDGIHYLKGQLFEDLLATGSTDIMRQNDLLCTVLESVFCRSDLEIQFVTGGSHKASLLKMQWLEKVRSRPFWTTFPLHHSLDKKDPDTWRALMSSWDPRSVIVIEDDMDVCRVLQTHIPCCQILFAPFGKASKCQLMDKPQSSSRT